MLDNNQNHDDETLLSLILAEPTGWREMLAELLQRHRQSLLARCYHYLQNRQDAEDATQETEVRVFRSIRTFRQDAKFRTWLFAIADRQCHDLARKRARHVLSSHLRELILIHEESLCRDTQSAEEKDFVNKMLTRLPGRDRDILLLRYYVDLPLKDVANYLGLGLSATKMRLYRALQSVGARIEAERAWSGV